VLHLPRLAWRPPSGESGLSAAGDSVARRGVTGSSFSRSSDDSPVFCFSGVRSGVCSRAACISGGTFSRIFIDREIPRYGGTGAVIPRLLTILGELEGIAMWLPEGWHNR